MLHWRTLVGLSVIVGESPYRSVTEVLSPMKKTENGGFPRN